MRNAPQIEHRTRGKLPVICPSSQASVRATHWHDGQISSPLVHVVTAHVKSVDNECRLLSYTRRSCRMVGLFRQGARAIDVPPQGGGSTAMGGMMWPIPKNWRGQVFSARQK
jgi:hypothetical protein